MIPGDAKRRVGFTMQSQLSNVQRSAPPSVFGRGVITSVGLVIEGAVQCFHWERQAQSRYASMAAKRAKHIVNIGYGLGFAHSVFESVVGIETALIEHNPWVMSHARSRSRSSATRFVLGSWEDRLKECASPDSTIFFDGFPIERDFDYRPISFARYLSPFFEEVRQIEWERCYFVAFDEAPLNLPQVRGCRSRRLARMNLPTSSRRTGVTNISLYELKRYHF